MNKNIFFLKKCRNQYSKLNYNIAHIQNFIIKIKEISIFMTGKPKIQTYNGLIKFAKLKNNKINLLSYWQNKIGFDMVHEFC